MYMIRIQIAKFNYNAKKAMIHRKEMGLKLNTIDTRRMAKNVKESYYRTFKSKM